MKKYEIIKENLIKYLDTKKVNDPLPSLVQLATMFNVSDITIRKAIAQLNNEGLIYSVERKGIFKAEAPIKFLDVNLITLTIYKEFSNEDSFFPWVIGKLENELRNNNMDMLLSCSNNNLFLEREIIKKIIVRKPYGVIANCSGCKENYSIYSELNDKIKNFVFLDRFIEGINAHYVGTDSYNGAIELGETVKNEKFDKIYIIIPNFARSLNSEKERTDGFLKSFEKRHNVEKIVFEDNLWHEEYIKKAKELIYNDLKENKYKRICFACINTDAIHDLYMSLRDVIEKLKYCKLLFFDYIPIDLLPNTSVSWYKQNGNEISRMAVDILKRSPKEKEKIYVKGNIFQK